MHIDNYKLYHREKPVPVLQLYIASSFYICPKKYSTLIGRVWSFLPITMCS